MRFLHMVRVAEVQDELADQVQLCPPRRASAACCARCSSIASCR